MRKWAADSLQLLSAISGQRFLTFRNNPDILDDREALRGALLDFLTDFANWDNSNVSEYLETSRALTHAAHESLGGAPGTKPLVVDPFAGGGSIPLEAVRVGADVYASDLNPVATFLNKALIEYIPQNGQKLADEVREWGARINAEAEKELAEFYPREADGANAIAYLWARTIRCEGPGCGAEVPLIRSLWLAKKANNSAAMQLVGNSKKKRVDIRIIVKKKGNWVDQSNQGLVVENPSFEGPLRRASATCPCCGYTTPAERIREQLSTRHGGTHDARMTAVVKNHVETGTRYEIPTPADIDSATRAAKRLSEYESSRDFDGVYLTPNEPTPTNQSHRSVGSLWIYGMREWRDVYTPRQLLVLTTFCSKLREARSQGLTPVAHSLLALRVAKIADFLSSLCLWRTTRSCVANTFGRQALPIVWDFGEMNPFAGSAGDWSESVNYLSLLIDSVQRGLPEESSNTSSVARADATCHPLPNDSAELFATDPPYYDAVVYAELSDFFYVWLKRAMPQGFSQEFVGELTPKERQVVVYHPGSVAEKQRYESLMRDSLAEGRRVLKQNGLGVVVFAHKSTSGWETMLQALVSAGWVVTASWPIDTERGGRMNAVGTASLASSVHLVCRPRDDSKTGSTGDWRDVLHELPQRIHDWMPRLAEEGVVGADAIFACLGPALELFSKHSKVEKANGDEVTLREYLVYVWAAVAKEALAMVFKGADASGFEEDARLTAMWLWTLFAGQDGTNGSGDKSEEEADGEESDAQQKGYVLEYDAARKIAQGLGANLESLTSLVEIKGEKATLLSVAERTASLFGKNESESPTKTRKKGKAQLQLGFAAELEQAEEAGSWGSKGAPAQGATILDRVHQSMILFAAGRGEALRRFLVDEGVGRDERFWRLAQVLSFLYPKTSDEKRWIDGVLARKKGLDF